MYCGDAVEQSTLSEVDRKTTTNHLPAATRMAIVYWCVVHTTVSSDTERAAINVFVKTRNATVEHNDIDRYHCLGSSGNNFKLHPDNFGSCTVHQRAFVANLLDKGTKTNLTKRRIEIISKAKPTRHVTVMYRS